MIKSKSFILAILVIHGCGSTVKKDSRLAHATSEGQSVDVKVRQNQVESGGVKAESTDSNALMITEDDLKKKIILVNKDALTATNSPITQPGVVVVIDPQSPVQQGPSSDKAVAIAKEQIAKAFATNMQAYPDVMTKEDSDYLQGQLNLFVENSVSGKSKEASEAWNNFATRVAKIKSTAKVMPNPADKNLGAGQTVVIVSKKSSGGLFTSLIGAATQVIDSGFGLVNAVLGQPVTVIGTTAKDLANQTFTILI